MMSKRSGQIASKTHNIIVEGEARLKRHLIFLNRTQITEAECTSSDFLLLMLMCEWQLSSLDEVGEDQDLHGMQTSPSLEGTSGTEALENVYSSGSD